VLAFLYCRAKQVTQCAAGRSSPELNFGSFCHEQAVLCAGFCSTTEAADFFFRTFETKKQNKVTFLTDYPIKTPQECTNKEKEIF